jgi:hypothetical protein
LLVVGNMTPAGDGISVVRPDGRQEELSESGWQHF